MDVNPSAPTQSLNKAQFWKGVVGRWGDSVPLARYEDKVLLVLTLIIGAVVGLVIAAFIYVTENLGSRMYPAGGAPWRRLAIPAAGALVTGWMLSRYFPNARGSGIPQTKAALFLRDGFIGFRTVVGKFVCSSISLASGIALGREGPSVHVGAGLASVFGRRLGLSAERVRDLIPVGASAALAAAFNTPVAAVLFSLEEVVGDLHAPVLGSIVLSSATSWIVLHLLLGDEPLFHVPAYQLVSPVEFGTYAVLGVVGGLVSVAFVKLLLFIRKRFLKLPKWSGWLQPAAGGLLVGVMGWFVPEVLGVGYQHVSEALNGQMALQVMALLVVLKLIATAACYGTGNAGGIFGPSLFIGAMLGGTVGTVAHQLLPDYTGGVGAYALVGMGAAFAGIVRVPLTSVIMIFEMTRDYSIIVPLMISNLMSYYISYKLQEEPIYEALQHQDGLHLPSGLRYRQGMLTVKDAAIAPPHVLTEHDRFEEALAFLNRDRNAWPVTDGQMLLGMVSLPMVEREIARGHGHWRLGEIFTPRFPVEMLNSENFPHVHMDHPVDVSLRRMARSKLNVLPVVSRANIRELKGIVAPRDILRAYGVAGEATQEKVAVVPQQVEASRRLLPGVVAAALALLILIGFLNYYYRSARGARAEQYFKTGTELAQQDRNAEAIEQFRNALSVSPGSERYRLALGLTLVRMGRASEGAVYLNEVLKRDPDNGAANLGLARIAASGGKKSDAVMYYHRAIDGTWPKDQEQNRLEARFELAEYLAKAVDKTQAIAELLAALGQEQDASTKKRIGRLLLEYGSPRQSADVFRGLIRTNGRDAEAYAALGAAELVQDDYVVARNAFENALRLDPSNENIRRQLEFTNRMLTLDPNAPGTRAAERFRRSEQLLQGALTAQDRCLPTTKDGAHGQIYSDLADSARKALAQHPRVALREDAAENNLTLAVQLWKARRELCSSQPVPDEAVARVLTRLARE
jgi:CIC family chloride channel protein